MWAMMAAVSLSLDYAGFKTLFLAIVLPPAPLLLLAAWGGWRLRTRQRFGGWMLALALALTWLSATEAGAELLSRAVGAPPALSRLERERQVASGAPGAVLVLGGGVYRHRPEYEGGVPTRLTADRLAYGVWLARRTGWPLAFSGGIGWTAKETHVPEAAIVARVAAEDYRLPLRWTEARSRDTRENASNTLPLLAAAGVQRVLLVTDDGHMRRALRAFEAVGAPLGIAIVPAPVGLRDDALSSFDDWCPSAEGFARVRNIVYETLAWWAGR